MKELTCLELYLSSDSATSILRAKYAQCNFLAIFLLRSLAHTNDARLHSTVLPPSVVTSHSLTHSTYLHVLAYNYSSF